MFKGAFFLVQTRVGGAKSVFREINDRKLEINPEIVMGPYDIFCVVRSRDQDRVNASRDALAAIDGVEKIITCLIC